MLGFPVAKQLKHDRFEVDILTTNPQKAEERLGTGYNFIQGDVRDRAGLHKILPNYDGLHINLNSGSYKELHTIEVEGSRNIAESLPGSGVKKITLISGLGVKLDNIHIPFIKAKLEVENVIKETGLPYTIFNCTHFMESIPLYIRNGKAMIIGKQQHKIHWLSAVDYAWMVSQAFENKESDFKNYEVTGPEALTMKEAFELYVEKKDPGIKVTRVSLGMLGFIARVSFNSKLKFLVDLMGYFDSTPEHYDPNHAPHILGKAETTLQDWLDQGQQ